MMNHNPLNPGGAYYPRPVLVPRENMRAIKLVIGVIVAIFMLLVGRVTLSLVGLDSGSSAFQTGALLATLPVPVYLLLILWLDRYESEPLWMLALTFLWGAAIATYIAIKINTRVFEEAGFFDSLVISAPIVEELAKALILFLLFFWKKDEFDGIMDGIVYAGMVGLGFAMTENILYYGRAAMMSEVRRKDFLTPVFILRGAVSPFAHPLFTSMTGIGLGWARQSMNKGVKFIMPVLGLILAMCVHASWNYVAYLAGEHGGMHGDDGEKVAAAIFLSFYGVMMFPIFVAVLVSVFFALRREGRLVRDFLYHDLQRGLFTPADYHSLCSVSGRMGASMRALKNGGYGLWRTRMKYNQAASELAFHRCRIARGVVAHEQESMEREAAYVQLLSELRRQLGPY